MQKQRNNARRETVLRLNPSEENEAAKYAKKYWLFVEWRASQYAKSKEEREQFVSDFWDFFCSKRRWEPFDESRGGSFLPFLDKMCQNKFKDFCRRRNTRIKNDPEMIPIDDSPDEGFNVFNVIDPEKLPSSLKHEQDPIQWLLEKEIAQRIRDAVKRLPKRQKQVFTLHFRIGLSVKDISAFLAISEATIKTHRANALKTLRDNDKLKDYYRLYK